MPWFTEGLLPVDRGNGSDRQAQIRSLLPGTTPQGSEGNDRFGTKPRQDGFVTTVLEPRCWQLWEFKTALLTRDRRRVGLEGYGLEIVERTPLS